ncbi:MAG TPA: hypothetical protein VGE04_17420, partial [Chloroflexia bacterium]
MILIDSEIEARITSDQLISDHDPENIRNCGYILRAGKVFHVETGEEDELKTATNQSKKRVWEIGPSEILVMRTREKVKMPNDLCATYAPLFRLSSQGVMLLNASIVEPAYAGYLSCFLVNFSSERISLNPNNPIAKIIFHKLSTVPTHPEIEIISDEDYETNLAKMA